MRQFQSNKVTMLVNITDSNINTYPEYLHSPEDVLNVLALHTLALELGINESVTLNTKEIKELRNKVASLIFDATSPFVPHSGKVYIDNRHTVLNELNALLIMLKYALTVSDTSTIRIKIIEDIIKA